MRLNRTLLSWGVFFLVLGAVPLAVRQGLVPESTVDQAWRLWPIILIAAGLGVLLRRTPLDFVAGVATAAIFGLILGSVIATGNVSFGCGDDRSGTAFAQPTGQLSPAASVDLQLNCGDLIVRTGAGNAWSFDAVADEAPDVTATPERLDIDSKGSGGLGFLGGESRQRWTLTLPTDPILAVDVQLNAGTADVDLAGAHVGRLKVNVNAGTAKLGLGSVAALTSLDVTFNAVGDSRIVLPNVSLTGSIDANAAANIRICPPAGAGLRLTVNDNITARNNYAERGLVRVGDAWETPGFSSAAVRIELETRVNAGGFDLEPEGTCNG